VGGLGGGGGGGGGRERKESSDWGDSAPVPIPKGGRFRTQKKTRNIRDEARLSISAHDLGNPRRILVKTGRGILEKRGG